MKIKKLIKNLLFFAVIPLLLISFWIFSLVIVVPSDNFFTITTNHKFTEKLLDGENKTMGKFTAKENNLGIVQVYFDANKVLAFNNRDTVIFRIKEMGNKSWHAENTYAINALENSIDFPFGFPVINDSENKDFEFEITTINNQNMDSTLRLDEVNYYTSKYVFSRNILLRDPAKLIDFLISKLSVNLTNSSYIFNSFIYLLPLIFYLLLLSIYRMAKARKIKWVKELRVNEFLFLHLIVLFLFIDLYLNIASFNQLIYIAIIPIWLFLSKKYNFDSSVTFLYTFLIFTFSYIAFIFKANALIIQISNWTFMLLITGAIQLFLEIKKDSNTYNYKDYLLIISGRKKMK